jgi:PIN domain nuclease of toxin-antitoxin system
VRNVVLDASAVLAVAFAEPGAEIVIPRLPFALLSAVNLAEATTRAVDRGKPLADVQESLATLPIAVVPFDADQAYAASSLRPLTRLLGLSLGDRACLALASLRQLPVLTADRSWAAVDLAVSVEFIR